MFVQSNKGNKMCIKLQVYLKNVLSINWIDIKSIARSKAKLALIINAYTTQKHKQFGKKCTEVDNKVIYTEAVIGFGC